MRAILQMHLKLLDAHPGAGVVQFARTIQTADAGEVLVEHVLARDVSGGRVRGVGGGVDGGAAHGAFEAGVWMLVAEGSEGGEEPGGGIGLGVGEWVSVVAVGLCKEKARG
jgi:hypothetical protein